MPRRWASSRAALLFYLPVMLADLFPWSLLIPLALWWAFRERTRTAWRGCCSIWMAAIVVFFSFSGTKEDLYILPIVTAEAALIGAMLAKAVDGAPIATPGSMVLGRPRRPLLVAAGAATILVVRSLASLLAARARVFIGVAASIGGRRPRSSRRASAGSSAPPHDGGDAGRHLVVHRAVLASGLRALQAGPAVSPTSSDPAPASAPSSVTTSSRCRAWCST